MSQLNPCSKFRDAGNFTLNKHGTARQDPVRANAGLLFTEGYFFRANELKHDLSYAISKDFENKMLFREYTEN